MNIYQDVITGTRFESVAKVIGEGDPNTAPDAEYFIAYPGDFRDRASGSMTNTDIKAKREVYQLDERENTILDYNGNAITVDIRPLSIFGPNIHFINCTFRGKVIFDEGCVFENCKFLASTAYVAKLIDHSTVEGVQIRVFSTINDTEKAVTGKEYVTKDFSIYDF